MAVVCIMQVNVIFLLHELLMQVSIHILPTGGHILLHYNYVIYMTHTRNMCLKEKPAMLNTDTD